MSRKTPQVLDVAIIGAGHNGLVCAAYLARRGWSVGVYERRPIVGGAAVTEEFWPGFRNSTASYTVSLFDPGIIRELRLVEHGLRILPRPVQNFLPLPNGSSLNSGPRMEDTHASLKHHSTRDAARLADWQCYLAQGVDFVRALLKQIPPAGLRHVGDLWSLLRTARQFRALDSEAQRTLHELFTRSAGEILDHWFESDAIKALYGFDAVVGNYASPYTPGCAYVLLHHAMGEVNGERGVWGHALGGMGAISNAIAAEARRLGVNIEVGSAVRRVVVENGATRGIELESGQVVHARIVAANVNPKLLYLKMIDAEHLPDTLRERMRRYRCGSASFRMNVALATLPRFTAQPQPPGHLSAGIIMAPSLGYMDRAHAEARLRGWSHSPIVEMLIPSTLDDSLAPEGAHVASLFCQHFAPHLPEGRPWSEAREEAAQTVLQLVDDYAPNFRASLLGYSALSPWDLEERFGLIDGDIFHGALGLDQLWAARPLLGFGDYRTPIRGLYLCGAGAHPGGGVTGLPGYNAARCILKDGRVHSSNVHVSA